jgi:deoxyribodipyrimidine photolyase-related protein
MNFLIFPTQLFKDIKHITKNSSIYLIEEPRYFTEFKFHKLKLAYHRASMKKYFDYLKKYFKNINYIDFQNVTDKFYKTLKNVSFVDPTDKKLEKKLIGLMNCTILQSPQFVLTRDEIYECKDTFYKNGKYHNDSFYKMMRIKLDILMENGKPVDSKWSFDKNNRKMIPNDVKIPEINKNKNKNKNKYVTESIQYINTNFPNNYGSLDNFIYPIDFTSSLKWLNDFLKNRLYNFGPYQDAVSDKDNYMFHSVITPMMNIGLLLDKDVINISYKYYLKNKDNIKIDSFEGFIRQIIGWRTYVYALYVLEGDNLYASNLLNHHNKLPKNEMMWLGKTGLNPIDHLINKIVLTGYVHHIERLMYLGNFLLICQIDPKEVYNIFMEWTIDAYEWVMIPNVFGMSQYGSNIMMSRPYFSSSKYILRMSNFKSGDWCEIWDALYYDFINKNKKVLASNYATAMQVKHWTNKTSTAQKNILNIADNYKKKLFI